jgi:hypothetical protein
MERRELKWKLSYKISRQGENVGYWRIVPAEKAKICNRACAHIGMLEWTWLAGRDR